MNVLVYSGTDTSPTSLAHTLVSLRTLLAPNYAVQPVAPQSLAAHPWSTSCALLVLPSFRPSGPGLTPDAAKRIQTYLSKGGRLLTLGMGVRLQHRTPASSLSLSALALSAGIAGLSLADRGASPRADVAASLEDPDSGLSFALTRVPESKNESTADVTGTVRLVDGRSIEGLSLAGAVDLSQIAGPGLDAHGVQPLAHVSLANPGDEEKRRVTGLRARIGRGSAVFWSFHFEGAKETEQSRLQLLRYALEQVGLGPPLPVQSGVARPLPQILAAAPWRAGIVDSILRALEIPNLAQPYELKDTNDTFLFHSHADGERVFGEEQREAAVNGSAGVDPTAWNPKHVVVYTHGAVPQRELTPRFNIATYYDELAKARTERGIHKSYTDGSWGMGEAILYGEVVTSTQTMLDKNTRLLSTLPTPLLSLASQQLTGRGRGTNVWLSPPGCLQFSLLLRAPLAELPASKMVFVQYLFALAVVEACRTDGVLGANAGAGMRIKWPNDLYAVTREGERKKVGGILVNTSFSAGKVELVVGCGLNVLNPPPIASLEQLLPERAAPPTMERTLAAIMARFERLWTEFVAARGSFASFMDLYLDRWLHSDQLVTLTTVTPPRAVRIVGITPDHGLLRTLPEQSGWSDGGGVEYIDLQPDGNSFDLMAGLIKTKT